MACQNLRPSKVSGYKRWWPEMTATLRFGASLKNMLGLKDEFPVQPGRSVREILISLSVKPELVAMVSVNDEMQTKDYIIQEGDVIRAMAVIGGG
jgi:sulfur carrier protein ThiS